jgi:hypothetical protein
MAILRGLSSRLLSCGCLAGVYETYEGDVVTIIDARGGACTVSTHHDGNALPKGSIEDTTSVKERAGQRDFASRARH